MLFSGRRFSWFDTIKDRKSTLKEKGRKVYKEKFTEMLGRPGDFPNGYIQKLGFGYKDHSEIFEYHENKTHCNNKIYRNLEEGPVKGPFGVWYQPIKINHDD